MKHLPTVLSALSFLVACSGTTEESAAPAAGGAMGFAGGGAGGVVAAGGAGQSGGGVGGSVTGSAGAAGAPAGTGGVSPGGTGGAAGASGGTSGAAGASGGGAGASGGGGSGGAAQSPEEALFTTNCSACHGATGEGGPLGPEIRHPVTDFTTWMVRNGSEPRNPNTTYPAPMLPLDTTMVSDAELTMIVGYLNDFPQPTTGPELFMDYCANCHGADGKGAATTRDLTMLDNPMNDVPMQVRDGAHAGEFEMLIEYMPAQNMSRLTDAELMLIATHVASL